LREGKALKRENIKDQKTEQGREEKVWDMVMRDTVFAGGYINSISSK
jgi:hypothetical protein